MLRIDMRVLRWALIFTFHLVTVASKAELNDVTVSSDVVTSQTIFDDVTETVTTEISQSMVISETLSKEVLPIDRTKSPNEIKTETTKLHIETNFTKKSEETTESAELELVTTDVNQILDTTEVYSTTKYLNISEIEYLTEELETTEIVHLEELDEFQFGNTSVEIDEDYDYVTSSLQSDIMVDGRIIGGTAAALADFPFAVHVTGTGSSGTIRGCTGALISITYVLVPASCVRDASISFNVRVGALQIAGATDIGTVLTLATPIIHPKYKHFPKDYNIALLRLRNPPTLSANVVPIELASKFNTDDNKDIADLTMTVVGFGASAATGAGSLLRSVSMTVLDKTECYTQIRRVTSIPYSSKQSCLSTDGGAIGLCGQNDIGALVVSRFGTNAFRLVGIVTYINGCTSNVPVLFTRVGPHYDWIRKF